MTTNNTTIDATPTWSDIIDIYIAVLEEPSTSAIGKQSAREEIKRAVRALDGYIAKAKALAQADKAAAVKAAEDSL